MPSIGPLELAVVLIIALVVLGPKRLPQVGRSVGRGMREFKHAVTGGPSDDVERPSPLASVTAGGRDDHDDLADASAENDAGPTERTPRAHAP